jgi:hypothetical protein
VTSFPGLDGAVHGGFGDLEHPANFRNRVLLLVEIKGNPYLFASQHFGSAAYSSSFSGCNKTCLSPLPDQVSLKPRKRTKNMKD